MRQESICVLIIVTATVFVPEHGCDDSSKSTSGKSATETIKEKVNEILSTQKKWKDITLNEELGLGKLKNKNNCYQARVQKIN